MESIKIGRVTIENPIALAPLAGVSDIIFRGLCREMGAGLVFTEMISAKAITYNNKNTFDLMKTERGEAPIGIQLFAGDEESLKKAMDRVNPLSFDIVDLNAGCPVPKVVKNGEGSALLKDGERLYGLVRCLVRSTDKPITVKIRIGFEKDRINAVENAKIIEEAGASAITVHGRTREEYFSGSVHKDIIKAVKEAVHIPILGNGDIRDGKTALEMVADTGCDGIMIGRGAMGNPWIFREIKHYLKTGESLPKPSDGEKAAMILRHGKMLAEYYGEYMGIRKMRSHAGWYVTGMKNAAEIRRRVNNIESYKELNELILEIIP